ncbi:MAG: tRNA guanosine(34) transglycosylase Tgt [Spirochaetia bacterium]|nr:tRNA guanosine(34) transglycosylase Tgt [Spirochaetia bacterium]
MEFEIIKNSLFSRARRGVMRLPHGEVQTPVFMPVGTNGSVKAMKHQDVSDMGVRLILGNTYHLYLRPGIEVIKQAGGLHEFTSWPHNILTDSGGFQVFSLAPFRKIKEEGIYFRSHIDGSYHTLTPEGVVDLQRGFRSDILMPLDCCTAPGITEKEAVKAMNITHRWAVRSKNAWLGCRDEWGGSLFGIVQGNFFEHLRTESAGFINSLDLPGIAIGGLSVGEEPAQFSHFLAHTASQLDAAKPHYLMGVGTPEYILDGVENGIDMFDCVYPTRIARNGAVFTRNGKLTIDKQKYADQFIPIDEHCQCFACRTYTRAFIRHMFKTGEILGPMLATEHNLQFMYDLMSDIRSSIENGCFETFKKDFLSRYTGGNREEQ